MPKEQGTQNLKPKKEKFEAIPVPGPRRTGRVKWYNPVKGYGFIVPDEPIPGLPRNKDLFLHFSAFLKHTGIQVGPNAVVSFTIGTRKGGLVAMAVETDYD